MPDVSAPDAAYHNRRMPRRPGYDEARVGNKPIFVRERARLTKQQHGEVQARWRARQESLLAVDEAVTRIIRQLEHSGVLDNTVVVFMSDNGYMLGEYRIPSEKRVPYRESTQVPLMIAGPGFRRGLHVGQPVSNVDIAPTIVRAARVEAGRLMAGRPLQRVRTDPEWFRNRVIMIERYDAACYSGVITRRFRYTAYVNGEEELYDYRDDPYELRTLHDDAAYRSIKRRLRRQLFTDELADARPRTWCGDDEAPPHRRSSNRPATP